MPRKPTEKGYIDPKEIQRDAQAAAIFYGNFGRRDPRKQSRREIETAVDGAFAVAQSAQAADPYLAAERSMKRYAGTYIEADGNKSTLADLVRDRQRYEEMLSMRRKKRASTDFYRVTAEETKKGIRYFVWPMPPGCYTPGPAYASRARVEEIAADLNKRENPYRTGRWWQYRPSKTYTKRSLSSWLPPASAFRVAESNPFRWSYS